MPPSVLFQQPKDRVCDKQLAQPNFFVDLNLNQIVAAVIANKEEYDLAPFFSMPLHDVEAVIFRHEVMQDLENYNLLNSIKAFAQRLHEVRSDMVEAKKDYYKQQNERWFLDAANCYVKAVTILAADLASQKPKSRGLKAFQTYLNNYVQSKPFKLLAEQAQQLEAALITLRYEILIEGLRVEVRHYKHEPNYSTEIQAVFKRFSQEQRTDYKYNFRDQISLNHVEGQILNLVSQSYSQIFSELAAFCLEHEHFMDDTIVLFDREIQFYVAYWEFIAKFQKTGLSFCYPKVSRTNKAVEAKESFDLALAAKLMKESKVPVTNDFYLHGAERIIVVSGPNQGGKTTFARTFGQLHYLASLGCLTPGTKGQFYLQDILFTHFEKEEKMTNLRGKLEDDLLRMRAIFQKATPHSIILINEIFTSTTLYDAISLSKKVAASIMKLDALCVWITFIDEIAALSEQTVSMVSEVMPNKPAVRTFKVTRKPADGLAYALSIAQKYRLTSQQIRQRIKQ